MRREMAKLTRNAGSGSRTTGRPGGPVQRSGVKSQTKDAAMQQEATEEGSAAVMLRKKDFLERVIATSGVKRAVARAVTDAVLKELGTALSQGENLVLPPLGKLRVTKQIDRSGAELLQVKIRRGGPTAEAEEGDEKTDDTPLAEAEN